MMFVLAFSPDGTRLASSSQAGTVTIWDVSSDEELLNIYAHADWIGDIEFNPDGDLLATSSLDGTAKIWDISNGQELLQLSGHTDGILSVAFDPRGDYLATASEDGTIRLWNTSLSREWLSFPTDGYIGRIAFSPDGSLMAAGAGPNGGIHLWDLDTRGQPVVFSEDGSQLASVGVDDSLKIWDAESGQLINVKEELEIGIIHDVVYSPDGSQLTIGGENYSFGLFDAVTLQKLSEFPNRDVVDRFSFNPDGELLTSTTRSGVARLWDVHPEEESQTLPVPADWLADITFSPDGDNLIIAGDDGTVSIWQLEEEKLQLTLRGHSASVTGVAYSPDGSRLATASQDGTARLWNAAIGRELLLYKPEGGASLVDVAFSPDGKYLATSADDAVRVYLLKIDDLVSLAEERLSRNLTLQECQHFLPASRCEILVSQTPTPKPADVIDVEGRICAFTDQTGIMKFSYYYQTYLGVKEATEKHDWDWLVFIPEGYETGPQDFERTLNADCNLIVGLGFVVYD